MSKAAQIATAGAAWAALPFVLGRAVFNRSWREDLPERLGGHNWLNASERRPIWLHGASMGEINGVASLVEALLKRYPDYPLTISTTSRTGRQRARELVGEGNARLMPLDHPLYLGKVLKQSRPRLVIVTETELWPNFLFSLRRENVPAVLVNGRISDYTARNYVRLQAIFKPALKAFKNVLVQTATDAERFRAVGVDRERIVVVGSTKYDRSMSESDKEALAAFAEELQIDSSKPCFVAGSVRPGEDRIILASYLAVKKHVPELQLILAPRHPEKFDEMASLMTELGIRFHRRSRGAALKPQDVILLDTMGELNRCYAFASSAFVGGSLVDIGGHNPLEPAAYAVPVLVGPYTSTVRDAVSMLKEKGGLVEVRTEQELTEALERYLTDEVRRVKAGRAAQEVWRLNLGATERVLEQIAPLLAELG